MTTKVRKSDRERDREVGSVTILDVLEAHRSELWFDRVFDAANGRRTDLDRSLSYRISGDSVTHT